MRSFFWPVELKAEPGCLGRLGRVLHWAITGGAAAGLGTTLYLYFFRSMDLNNFGGALAGIAIVFLVGRVVCYVLSSE